MLVALSWLALLFYLWVMKIIECPRDAMQSLDRFIETDLKVEYLNALLRVGFDTLDFGSFVSAKAIPQLRDTAEVVRQLDRTASQTRLLAIVANARGAEEALNWPQIDCIGFPLSISETFQLRNTNKSIAEGFETVEYLQHLCSDQRKTLVVYLSMGFGNPYGDPYRPEIIREHLEQVAQLGVTVISLADTIGVSTPAQIRNLFTDFTRRYPTLELGVHLHSNPATAEEKIRAALESGCKRMDGALLGYGGCPMAGDHLVGNVATEQIISCLTQLGRSVDVDLAQLETALRLATRIFGKK